MSNIKFNVTIEHLGHKWEVDGTYTPERPAPICSNHDSPAFSDPGDPGELEIESIRFHPQAPGTQQHNVITLHDEFIEHLQEDDAFYDLVTDKIGTSYGDEADRGDYEYEREKDRRLGL